MNTNVLKKFAQEARRKLIELVGAKLELVLNTDSAELREKAEQLRKLQEAINASSKEQVIDKVAYTWFNRLMALRFMDANDYQPIGVRVITPKDGYSLPELLDEAKQGSIPEDLPVKQQHIYDILDGKVNSSKPQNEAFKELLIGACNHLNKVFPFLFERINDYAELLLPDDLISEFSIVHDVREGMTNEDCQEVEVIGWLYQFYISERKDEVFASKGKVEAADIPAATQLFTPRWIVEYMVQNTVGKLWLQNNPSSKLKEHMPYYIESPSSNSEDYLKVDSVEEITLLDQACGSGHILVYGFELFIKIYEEQGYNPSEIPQLIIEKNLHGFEIDERASQLAGFALMMKAREYQRRVFRKDIRPNILCYSDLNLSSDEIKEALSRIGVSPSDELLHDLGNMQQATNLGSLIIPHSSLTELEKVYDIVFSKFESTSDAFLKLYLEGLTEALKQLKKLATKYQCVVDNPPYMGGGNMNKPLADFVKKHYPNSKADLMACFMEAGTAMLLDKGFLGMINQHSWMFLSSYEKLRESLIDNTVFDTLLHLGPRTFPEIGGEVVQNASFTFWNTTVEAQGKYIRLVDFKNTELKEVNTIEAIKNPDCGWFYNVNQNDFEKIPGSPISYWASSKCFDLFEENEALSDVYDLRQGMATSDNLQFLRLWHEEVNGDIFYGCQGRVEAQESGKKWFPYNKGGEFRKWYGNNFYVVNWLDDGNDIKNTVALKYPYLNGNTDFVVKNQNYYFREGLTWSSLSSGAISFRYSSSGFLFDAKGQMLFGEDLVNLIGFLNSNLANYFLQLLTPTLDYNLGYVSKVPTIATESSNNVSKCINISREEWNSRETSWDFTKNELIRVKGQDLEESFDLYQHYWTNKFFQLHKNEEELNKQFIEIYGLQEELTPDVPLKDITILKEETDVVNGELVFDAKEVMTQFMSYAAGCMFGRYSLDKEGLILANQGETLEDYLTKVEKTEDTVSFLPDDDNIIPILDDEWFEDDVVGRFYEFLKVSFGTDNFEKNLAFVEECLGKDIRKFFVKDFYADHIKRYKKRPIYWQFSSPKGSFNVLIYMHRYTPDTLNQILNGYLKEYREKLTARAEHLEHIKNTGSASEQSKAIKEQDKIKKVLFELQEYERDVLYPLATERIAIDLDDGVLVNYNKFGDAIKLVKGLNDKKAKDKVKKFDWINTEEII